MNNEVSINILNQARLLELTAIHQYMTGHYKVDDQDYPRLADVLKGIAIQEMKHAERLGERIAELGGKSDVLSSKPMGLNGDVMTAFKISLKSEQETIDKYNDFVHQLSDNNDEVSRNLIKQLIVEEQGHYTRFEDILSHIDGLGTLYLAREAGA